MIVGISGWMKLEGDVAGDDHGMRHRDAHEHQDRTAATRRFHSTWTAPPAFRRRGFRAAGRLSQRCCGPVQQAESLWPPGAPIDPIQADLHHGGDHSLPMATKLEAVHEKPDRRGEDQDLACSPERIPQPAGAPAPRSRFTEVLVVALGQAFAKKISQMKANRAKFLRPRQRTLDGHSGRSPAPEDHRDGDVE